ncbi:hypothetical protein [uncultured Tateyamaria sp.]|uniref:hypothetical protein n=1 Tax=uncultured Tateyamaria sp. TaxID=455651 RepID=UPI0026099FA7|nr:hypothetical protein [uncultured Tateyamaria sp.]
MDSEYIPEGVESREVYLTALDILKSTSEDALMNVKVLIERISKKMDTPPKHYLVYRDLNIAAQDSLSQIRSKKGRNGGYFRLPKPAVGLEKTPTQKDIDKEKTLEKHLWPLVSLWLKQVKRIPFASDEIANLKGGGKWSNPDVVGLNPIEELGFFDVEVTTVEVKPTLTLWRQFFFEAVSHKRFSERVYFIYRATNQDADQVEEIRKYAEKYGVGLVSMELTDDDYESLRNWKRLEEDDRSALLEYFVEIMPAPFEAISVRDKIQFLKQLRITTKSDLYTFGM